MRCEQIMTRNVEHVTEQQTVQMAARRMREANIGFLPVCNGAGEVLGVLTDRDLALRVCADNRSAAVTRVGEVMTREVVACRPSDDVRLCERLMGERKKSRMLVTDESGRLVGVISLSDVAEWEEAPQAARTMREVSEREARAH